MPSANPAKPSCKHIDLAQRQVGPEVTIKTASGAQQQCLSCAVDTVLAIQRYSEPFKVVSLINFFPRGRDKSARNYAKNRGAFRDVLLLKRRELYAEGLRREAYQIECTVDFLDTMRGHTMPVTHEQRAAKRKAKAEKLAKLERMDIDEQTLS